MASVSFYLILIVIIAAICGLYIYQRRQTKNRQINRKREPILKNAATYGVLTSAQNLTAQTSNTANKKSAYASDVIALQIQAFPDKPYMGYELLQSLLSVGLKFGDMNIFHRYEEDTNNVLFSIAAATTDGVFTIDKMGAFKCLGLVAFMRLDPKQKLMARFDLMLDVVRQLVEELGGEIYDDLEQVINAAGIRRLREKICTIETGNLYAADLLDNLD